ncbi:MAG TPA: ABC transporter permease [Gammaproteobacteria bacterium]|jgi:simple sugar transport system permease protein|nr:ABC transporter permease [Acidiferrobacteraceae bacterium]HAG45969.1 ABC transporter permease [Gammaproteobacteria bacterium]HAN61290.1 ABC transporter permease [Gammaproteobacteria bacterium]HAU11293.1 ABC transporter permease [Gammaproteobacteria bacterium]HIA88385.1 ABC transporter permease [Gammaproteobacteria bacterium]|tara:strand:+ start:980 stop:1882 length:903 start_codon:yes stop_codon:yes gene_type:complete
MEVEHLWGILFISLHAMVPITLAAIGETIEEAAGLFNIGLEGILLLSALTGALGAEMSGSATVGLLAGLSTGALIGGLFGFISTYWRGSQLISGVGINLFAFGFVAFMLINLGAPGFHSVPRDVQVKMISLGVGSLSPLVFVTVGLAIAVYWMLRRTQLGIRIRSVGENPAAADVAGINVNALRLATALAAGAFAGLAGAYLSVDWLGAVTKELTAGRGFIALATVVFSGLNPLLALFGGFVFGFFDGFATWVSTYPKIKDVIPWQFVAMAPYIVTLLVVAGAIGRVRFPAALGVPYRRE